MIWILNDLCNCDSASPAITIPFSTAFRFPIQCYKFLCCLELWMLPAHLLFIPPIRFFTLPALAASMRHSNTNRNSSGLCSLIVYRDLYQSLFDAWLISFMNQPYPSFTIAFSRMAFPFVLSSTEVSFAVVNFSYCSRNALYIVRSVLLALPDLFLHPQGHWNLILPWSHAFGFIWNMTFLYCLCHAVNNIKILEFQLNPFPLYLAVFVKFSFCKHLVRTSNIYLHNFPSAEWICTLLCASIPNLIMNGSPACCASFHLLILLQQLHAT